MTQDFSSDIEDLGIHAEDARHRIQDGSSAPRPAGNEPPRPPRPAAALGSALRGIFDEPGILPRGVVAPPYRGRAHACCRCCRLADEAIAKGQPVPPIAQAESWIGPTGQRVWAGTCARCTDIEYSMRWTRRYALAQKAGDQSKQDDLERERQRWQARGRAFHG